MRKYKELKSSEIKILKEKIAKEQNYICPVTKKQYHIDDLVLDHKHKQKKSDVPDINKDGASLIRSHLSHGANVMEGKVVSIFHRSGLYNEGHHLPTLLRNLADFFEKYEDKQEYYTDEDGFCYIHPTEVIKPKKLQKSSYDKLVKELKKINFKNKIPEYPKSGLLTQALEKLFELVKLEPIFYA